MKRDLLTVLCLGLLVAAPALAQEAAQTPDPQAKQDEIRRAETIEVVSASRAEQALVDAPATMSVVTASTIESSPAQNYGDLLRSVPGLNVIQTSARDINMTSRQSTNTLVNSQLVLVDGRSVYLDFFGLVLWDLIPTNPADIKQIEVVRGPASVVWGANALTGVVNVITKSPREAEGFGLTLNAGLFGRDGGSREEEGSGNAYGGSFFYASAPNDTWSYRLSAGYFDSDPYSRPVGIVGGCPPLTRCVPHPLDSTILTGGARYPPDDADVRGGFANEGTQQPRAELRIDQELGGGGRLSYQAGYAGSQGIVHTGIGPFRLENGSYGVYGRVLYTRGALRIGGFGNFFDAEAPNLLLPDPTTGGPVQLNFKTQTYDFEIGNTSVLGEQHILSYGGNYRRNNFDITLTPDSEDRNELGAYGQWEWFTSNFRIAAGARVDKFGNIDDAVVSPRVMLMYKPTPDHSLRASYNRAFRAPSVVNNYLDQDILNPEPIPLCQNPQIPACALNNAPLPPVFPSEPFLLQVKSVGNLDLVEENIDAFEIAYVGTFGRRTTVGLAVYRNDQNDNINFTNVTSIPPELVPGLTPPYAFYSPQNPARGIGVVTGQPIVLSTAAMAILPLLGRQLPSTAATYLNLSKIRNEGFEASIDHGFTGEWSAYANYSYQKEPKLLDPDPDQIPYPVAEVGVPPTNRFNLGVGYSGKTFLGNVNLNYSDEGFWNDVLNEPYWGYTEAYTMVNATFGVKLADGKVTLSVKGTNIFDEKIQQHIFGDILRRAVVAEVRFYSR
jgi:outer membrane receptor protein involved in Fe transport